MQLLALQALRDSCATSATVGAPPLQNSRTVAPRGGDFPRALGGARSARRYPGEASQQIREYFFNHTPSEPKLQIHDEEHDPAERDERRVPAR